MAMTWNPHVVLILIAVATPLVLLGVGASRSMTTASTPLCLDEETRENARRLMLDGLETGFKQHTAHLYNNRLKDREHHPDRILAGMRNAVWTYTRSRAEVKRWAPPPC